MPEWILMPGPASTDPSARPSMCTVRRAIERRIDDVDIQMSNFRTPARIAAVFGTGDRDDQP